MITSTIFLLSGCSAAGELAGTIVTIPVRVLTTVAGAAVGHNDEDVAGTEIPNDVYDQPLHMQ